MRAVQLNNAACAKTSAKSTYSEGLPSLSVIDHFIPQRVAANVTLDAEVAQDAMQRFVSSFDELEAARQASRGLVGWPALLCPYQGANFPLRSAATYESQALAAGPSGPVFCPSGFRALHGQRHFRSQHLCLPAKARHSALFAPRSARPRCW